MSCVYQNLRARKKNCQNVRKKEVEKLRANNIIASQQSRRWIELSFNFKN